MSSAASGKTSSRNPGLADPREGDVLAHHPSCCRSPRRINLGQNLQALGLERLGAAGKLDRPCDSKMWIVGMSIFAVSALVTFGALALASASVLVPLESIQFLVNLLFGRFVRKKTITRRMSVGTLILVIGVTMVVCFGVHESYCFDEATLQAFWASPTWIVYLICTFAIAAALYVIWRRYTAARKAGSVMWRHDIIEPVSYTLSSALFGGGQMIVHTKLLAELLELSAASGDVAFARPFFWLELLLVIVFGGYWLFRLSQCLAFYDALFIIPLMQTSFIIFGAFAGGTYFQEFDDSARAEPRPLKPRSRLAPLSFAPVPSTCDVLVTLPVRL